MNTEKTVKAPVARHKKNTGKARHAAKVPMHNIRSARKTKKRAAINPIGRLFTRLKAFAARRREKRKLRPRNKTNTRAAMWLWCFPVGLSLMWRSACTWKRGVKIAVSCAMAAILVAVFIAPTPRISDRVNGVEMVAEKPDVEVYGPALPTLIVPGYTRETTGSIIADEIKNDVHYVYAADDARCYHEYECKFAFASSQRMTVYEAYYLGFEPCGRCKPPVYTPGVTDPITAEIIGGETAADANAATDATAETAAAGEAAPADGAAALAG